MFCVTPVLRVESLGNDVEEEMAESDAATDTSAEDCCSDGHTSMPTPIEASLTGDEDENDEAVEEDEEEDDELVSLVDAEDKDAEDMEAEPTD